MQIAQQHKIIAHQRGEHSRAQTLLFPEIDTQFTLIIQYTYTTSLSWRFAAHCFLLRHNYIR